MSDETPRDPVRETPAPRLESGEAADSGPMRKGIWAALGFFAASVAAEAAVIGLVLAVADTPEGAGTAFNLALIVAALALVAAVLVARRLPRASRTAFWATGIVCIGFVMTVLIGVCAVQFARTSG